MASSELENVSQETGIENVSEFLDDSMADLPDQEHFLTPEKPSESEEEEDDDNITVTLPTAHQQCRGANFRDSRLRRIPSHGLESQSSVRSSQDDETESFGENNSDNYSNRVADSGSKRSHNNNDRYEIPTLGGDKNGNQGIYPIHSSSSSHSDYSSQQQQQQQPQQSSQNYQNPSQNSGMMQQQMHPQSMYQQNHYQGNYYPPNQMR